MEIPYSLNTTNFTIEYDVKLNTLQNYNAGITSTVGNIANPIDFYVHSTGATEVWLGRSVGSQNFAGPTINAGQWYHIAIVVTSSPSKSLKMIVDGVEVINTNFAVTLENTGTLLLGDRADGVTNADAAFDNVRIWSIVRTTQEIIDNKSSCLTGNESGLDVYYTFEGVSGTSVEDYATANGTNNGTITGSYSLVTGTGCSVEVSAPTTNYTTQVYTNDTQTLANLSISGANIQWYNAASGGSPLSSTTTLVDDTTYYASQSSLGVESSNRLAITVNKISESTQNLTSGNTVAELVSSPSSNTSAEWFTASSGGSVLASTEVLSVGTYYVQQATATGLDQLYSGSGVTDVAVQSDGKIVWSSTDGTIKRMDADGGNVTTLVSGLNNPYGIGIQSDGKILIAESYAYNIKRVDADGSNMVTLFNQSGIFVWDVAVQSDGKIVFCTLNNVVYRMDSDGSNNTAIINVTGLSSPRGIAVQSDDKILIANYNSDKVVRTDADGTNMIDFVTGFKPNKLSVRSNGKVLITDNGGVIKEYNSDGSGEATLISTSSPQAVAEDTDGNVIVSKSGSVNRVIEASTSNRVAVAVNLTTATPSVSYSTQVYTGNDKTLNDLSVTGTNIKWYDAASNGNLLASSTSLSDETTYYASQTVQSIESTGRVSVKVNKISENSQVFSSGATVADLVTTPSTSNIAEWYSVASGGSKLLDTDNLSTATYYVQQAIPAGLSAIYTDTGTLTDVAVQEDGKIVWSSTDGKIKRIDSDGSNMTVLASGLNNPYGIAIQSDGKILIAESYAYNLKRMDSDGGNMVTLFNQSGIFVWDVAVQSDGKIVFCTLNNVVYRMNADGSNTTPIINVTGLSSPRGIAVQSDDKILIANYSSNKVVRTDANGTNMVDFITGFRPGKVSVQENGKVLVTDNTTSTGIIKQFNSDGTGEVVLGTASSLVSVSEDADNEIIVLEGSSKTINRIVDASNSNRVAVSVEISVTLDTENTDIENKSLVYPNPSSGVFNFTLKENADIIVLDATGKLIYSNEFRSGNWFVNLSSYKNGVYLLIINSEKESVIKKIIKQ